MKKDSTSGEQQRPTAVDDPVWRLWRSRAESVNADFEQLVEGVSSRSTAWRADSGGATPQLVRKVDAKLEELEKKKGVASRGDLLRQWTELGAELLMLKDELTSFRGAIEGARDILAYGRRLTGAVSKFKRPVEPDDT